MVNNIELEAYIDVVKERIDNKQITIPFIDKNFLELLQELKERREFNYQKLAMRTNTKDTTIATVGLGLCGEAGEVADLIKKHLYHGHTLNRDDLAKELGDVCWYIALGCELIGYNFDEILKLNIKKLKKRYPNGFKTYDSVNRKE